MTFHLNAALVIWIAGALVGVGFNVYMVNLSFWRRRRLALTKGERLVTWYDSVQWSFGLFVKLIALGIGFWATQLPPAPPLPPDAAWSVRYGRDVITYGLLAMIYGMDIRDGILVYFSRRWWY